MVLEILHAFKEEPVLMALLGVLLGAYITYKFNVLAERRKERNEKFNIANLLQLDLETLWNRYYQVLGRFIEQEEDLKNPPLNVPIEQSYFTVFDSIAQQMGVLDNEVANKVLSFYALAKAYHLDTLKSYNELCNQLRELKEKEISARESGNSLSEMHINDNLNNRLSQIQIKFVIIKKEHSELKNLFGEANIALKNFKINI